MEWHPHMQSYSWIILNSSSSQLKHYSPWCGGTILMTCFEYGLTARVISKHSLKISILNLRVTTLIFLDTSVYLKNGQIQADLYTRPTDTHQYLDTRGCHPCHCKTAIPYRQALRLRRIKNRVTCKSSNVIYLIQCAPCRQQYVGETGQPLHARMNNHRADITQKRDSSTCGCTFQQSWPFPGRPKSYGDREVAQR